MRTVKSVMSRSSIHHEASPGSLQPQRHQYDPSNLSGRAAMIDLDNITVIRARHGKRLAKIISADGITDFDAAFRFDLFEQHVADLDALHRLLADLLHRPDCAVVRGVPLDFHRTVNVRRLAYCDRETGDQPTLRDASHQWLALDLENVARPDVIPASDLATCGALAIQRLPAAFHQASCLIAASASHGLKPGVRLRLWYWLSRPTSGIELKRWLRGAPADPSVFHAVQPIYTAAPVFADGLHDHLPIRLITQLGSLATVAVPSAAALAPPRRPLVAPLPPPTAGGAGAYAFAALRGATVRVAQAREGSRHAALVAAARSLARFISAGLLTEQDVRAALGGAITQAGKEAEEAERVLAWAITHPSAVLLPAIAAR
jgi:hypothetical protein